MNMLQMAEAMNKLPEYMEQAKTLLTSAKRLTDIVDKSIEGNAAQNDIIAANEAFKAELAKLPKLPGFEP